MPITEIDYKSRNNTIDLLLKEGGDAEDLASVTRMILRLVNSSDEITTIDYDDDNDYFDWSSSLAVTGKVIVDIGSIDLDVGTYKATLIVYDASNTSGIVWGTFTLKVKDTTST